MRIWTTAPSSPSAREALQIESQLADPGASRQVLLCLLLGEVFLVDGR